MNLWGEDEDLSIKNTTVKEYGKMRTLYLWGEDEDISIKNTTVEVHGKVRNLYRSKFCICPVGSKITNSRVMLAIHHGCVPGKILFLQVKK